MDTQLTGAAQSGTRRLAVWLGGAMLAAFVVYATVRESGSRPVQTAVAVHPEAPATPARQALTAEEARYASALWEIHSQVKSDAVKVTFAGLSYKMGDIDKGKVRDRVAPLTQAYSSAIDRASAIVPPANLAALHGQYVDAIRAYRDATVEMVKVADDGSDAHLIAAQEMTEKAARVLLKASDALWPGEYKPN